MLLQGARAVGEAASVQSARGFGRRDAAISQAGLGVEPCMARGRVREGEIDDDEGGGFRLQRFWCQDGALALFLSGKDPVPLQGREGPRSVCSTVNPQSKDEQLSKGTLASLSLALRP